MCLCIYVYLSVYICPVYVLMYMYGQNSGVPLSFCYFSIIPGRRNYICFNSTNIVKFALFSLIICPLFALLIGLIHYIFLLRQKVDTINQYNSLQRGARLLNASLVLYCKTSWVIHLSILILANPSLKHRSGFLMNKMYLNSNIVLCNVNCVGKI